MHGLVCLYLQQNAIEKIEGLQNLHHLHSLNLSNNRIRKIEGLEGCPDLDTLDISNNRLISLEDVQALSQLKKLTVLDIQNNYINDERVIEEVFNQMPELGVIYLQLNPIVNKTKNYRKRLISGLPLLKYLDDRPIFPEERRCVMAWVEGGLEAEQDERHKIIEEKEAARKKNLADFEAMQQRSRQRIMEEQGISSDDPSLYQSYGIDSDTESEGSDEEAEQEAGPVEVKKTEETEEPAPTNEEDNLSVHQIKIEEVEENEVD
jgi:dynein assembly factor 1